MPIQYKASAPGTLMLFGEHAVLRNKMAICAATDQRIEVFLAKRKDRIVVIDSGLGHLKTSLDEMNAAKPFQFVVACIKPFLPKLKTGFDIYVKSSFDHTVGLGSSAAVTVATTQAIIESLGIEFDEQKLLLVCRKVIQDVQGTGSGADIAASIYGGIVAYKMDNDYVSKLPHIPNISLVYSGRKEATKTVIDLVNRKEQNDPRRYQLIFNNCEHITEQAICAIEAKNWELLAQCMKEQQLLMQDMGVSNQQLDRLVKDLEAQPNILAAKISGSGLGDSIVALGKLPANSFPHTPTQSAQGVKQLNVCISPEGVNHESP